MYFLQTLDCLSANFTSTKTTATTTITTTSTIHIDYLNKNYINSNFINNNKKGRNRNDWTMNLMYSLSPKAFNPKSLSMIWIAVSKDKKGRMIEPGFKTFELFSSDIFYNFCLRVLRYKGVWNSTIWILKGEGWWCF